ncbi:hypothetical protein SAMN05421736_11637 [Evansella caseinilytica]|uniref:Uncharacterized protein n=1 Tax=Evansella caseinilytica TaxID=1503961 RepID=A0A1H3TTK9_9BACI|nr:hypothetical protein SAMN05421736_11637 [Evansella caseinilytica]
MFRRWKPSFFTEEDFEQTVVEKAMVPLDA